MVFDVADGTGEVGAGLQEEADDELSSAPVAEVCVKVHALSISFCNTYCKQKRLRFAILASWTRNFLAGRALPARGGYRPIFTLKAFAILLRISHKSRKRAPNDTRKASIVPPTTGVS